MFPVSPRLKSWLPDIQAVVQLQPAVERLVVPLIHHIQKLTERVDELESELKLLSVSRSDIG